MGLEINAQVSITEADLSNICVDGGYYGLDDIIIEETNPDDFAISAGTVYLTIEIPANFEFKTTAGDVFYTDPGNDFNNPPSYSITTTQIEIAYNIDNTAEINRFRLSNFQIRAITSASSGNITRVSSSTGTDATIIGAGIGTVFGNLSSIESPSITSQPTSETICEEENVNFSVTATGNGLSYQWQRNDGGGFDDIDLSTDGSIYSNFNSPTLQVNNTPSSANGFIYRVNITGSCLPIATSNSVTLTVNSKPITPTITFLSGTSPICDDTNPEITLESSVAPNAGTYEWFKDGVSTGITTQTIDINDPIGSGNYTVTITDGSTNCKSDNSAVESIVINPLPNDGLTVTPSATAVCDGNTLTFTIAGSQSGVNYQLFDESNTAVSTSEGGTGSDINIISNPFDFPSLGSSEIITVRAINASTGCEIDLTDNEPITINEQPIADAYEVDATSSFEECGLTHTVNAKDAVGTGTWTLESGSGNLSFEVDANTPDQILTVDDYGSYTFRWTDVNGTCSDFDEISVDFFENPTVANAGADIDQCNNSTFTMAANAPAVGTGTWTQTAGAAVSITNINSPTTTITGLTAGNSATLRWTVSNGNCADSFDEMVITNDVQPVADAGTGGEVCGIGASNPFTFSATASVGTGTWTKVSGAGVATFDNENDPVSEVAVDDYGSYTFRWTDVNGTCSDFDEISVDFFENPTVASAGPDIDQCNNSTFTMAANAPAVGTGTWTQTAGAAVSITNINSPTTTITGLTAGNSATLRWTVSNGNCTDSFDEMVITNDVQPVADAGTGGEVCGIGASNPFTFSATASVGTGTWTKVSGAGVATFDNENDPVSEVAVDDYGSYTFRWTDVNGTCSDFDEISVDFFENPTVASAGPDIDQCNNSTFTMAANAPAVGTGTWTQTAGAAVSITNINSPTTTITGLTAGNSATLRWTVSNGNCADSFDEMVITNDVQPVADAGTGGEVCGIGASNPFTFSATASVGTGTWTNESATGTATFSNPNSATSEVTVNAYGSYTFRWTEANGTCSDFDEISVDFFENPTVASAGPDIDQCNNSTFTMAANAPAVGTGTWTQTAGFAVSITNINSPTTTITGLTAGNSATLRWTVSNGNCTDSFDEMVITNDVQPVADAGTGGEVCGIGASNPFTFSATASVGTGTWTKVSGAGVATFDNENDPVSEVAVDDYGSYIFRWTDVNGTCSDFDEISVDFFENPTVASAGPDIDQCNNSTFTMAANAPAVGTGTWTQTAGAAVSITNINSPTTTITGLTAGNSATLRWTVSNGNCADSFDEMVITNDVQPVADAGTGGEVCGIGASNPFTFSATASVGTGTWTNESATGTATFSNPNSATSEVTVNAYGSYTFRWTEANGTCSDFDEISVDFFENPTVASAGPDIDQCNNSTFTMAANAPAVGTGTWTQTAGFAVSITNINSPTTTITGLTAGNSATLRWTVSNGNCTDSFDEMVITNDVQPVADAGTGGEVCGIGASNPFTFSATASVGTGTWTKVSGAGVATFDNENDPVSEVAVDDYGSYIFRWTEANGTCDDFDEVIVDFFEGPTTATAGPDIDQCNNSTFTMAANAPAVGTGTWTQTAGFAVSITNINSPTTTITGLTAGNSATLRWTVSNGNCADSFDEMVITNDVQPVADAGTGGEVCGIGASNPFTFSATASVGTGTWTKVSGAGVATFDNENDPVSEVAVDDYGSYTFRWTDVNGTCSDFDEISVDFFENPTVANAGADIDQCNNSTFTMAANAPAVGTGTWTQTAGAAVSITNINSPTTTITGLTAGNSATLRWTVSNGNCTDSFDEMVITNDVQPVADAGTGGEVCGIGASNPFTFSATASVGTGTWTNESATGTATFSNPNSATSEVTVNAYGSYTFRWTEANGTCSDFDEISVDFFENPTVANAGADIDQCNNSTFTMAANAPAVGTGTWTQTAGFAVSITNINSPTTTITGLTAGNSATLRWTVSNGNCTDSFDEMVITNDVQPVADAGTGGEVCGIGASNPFTFSAGPSIGTGTWTNESSTGTATFSNPNSATSEVTVNAYGSYTFRWTEANDTCDDFDEVIVDFFEGPTTATAGPDIDQCNNSTFTLAANAPAVGTGTWTQTAGAAVSITNINSPTTTITGLTAGNSATLRWTVSNGNCADSFDEMVITNDVQPVANAGTGGEVCGIGASNPFTFSATASVGTGTWTKVSGAGVATFDNENDPVSEVAVDDYGSYVFRWTEANGTCDDFDEVIVDFFEGPTTATAGPDIDQCNNSTFTMAANAPAVGTGTWTQTAGAAVSITNINSPTTTITGLTAGNSATLRWTVSNGNCADSFDEMVITNNVQPVANAGTGGEVCGIGASNPFTFSATASVGTGTWTKVSGAGVATFDNENDPVSEVAVDDYGSYVFRWTEANGTCDDFDEVIVNFEEVTAANAGVDDETCVNTVYTVTDATVTNSAGILWTHNGAGILYDKTTINPTYAPSTDDVNTIITLTLTVSGAGTCPDDSDLKELTINPTPTIPAFFDPVEVCEDNSSFDLTTIDLNATPTGGTYSYAGVGVSGTIFDATAVSSGIQEIQVTYTSPDGCQKVKDINLVEVIELPTANAGADLETCEDSPFTVTDAAVANDASVTWTHDGNGTLDDINTLTPTYNPVTADAGNNVTLTLTVGGNGSCSDAVDSKLLFITDAPTANAGADLETCEDSPFTVTDAAVANDASVTWTHDGNGSFTAGTETTVNPEYVPDPTDAGNNVTLTLTVGGNGSCSDAVDSKLLFITDAPTANAGADLETCEDSPFTVTDAAVANDASVTWTHDGNGTLDDINTLTPTYNPVTADAGNNVTLTLTVSGNGSCSDAVDSKLLFITDAPTANAGADLETCEDSPFTVTDAAVANDASVTWTHDGNGTLDDINTLTPTYNPVTADAGNNVTLTLTVGGNGSCSDAVDSKLLFITDAPTANAGADLETCEDSPFTVTDAAVANDASVTWTHDGNGSFTAGTETTVNPEYVPDPTDAGNNVTLTLTVSGNGSCSDAVDSKLLFITDAPTANAGADLETCEDSPFTVTDAAVANDASVTWTHDGNGTLDDINTLTPTYNPVTADAGNNVTLTLTVGGNGSCSDAVDSKLLFITDEPTANAGADLETCEDSPFTVTDAAVANDASVTWTHDGNGSFTAGTETTVNPEYVPDPTDAGNNVTLTLTVGGNGSCSDAVDSKLLFITDAPTANAGADLETCEDSPFTVTDAAVANDASVTWTHDGNGTLDDINTLTPTYNPVTADAGNNVTLTLTVGGNGSCSDAVDSKLLFITDAPTANAGADLETCEDSPFTVTDAAVANDASVTWTHDGNGTLDDINTLTPTYNPVTADAGNNVTLTLTVGGNGSCSDAVDSKLLFITDAPTANAGADLETCEDSPFTVTDAAVANDASVTWTHDGNGSFTAGTETTVNPEYVPDPTDAGNNVTLTLTVSGNGSCSDAVDSKLLFITDAPTANAGADLETCEDSPFTVTDAAVANDASVTWTHDGNGSFTAGTETTVNPEYVPDPTDAGNNVTLTLTVGGNGSCSDAVDSKLLFITDAPTANAGADLETCEDSPFTVTDAAVANDASVTWTHDGNGTLDDINTLTPTYNPVTADAGNNVILTLTVSGNGSCVNAVDTKSLFIGELPTSSIVTTASEVCEADPFTLTGTIGGGSTSGLWRIKAGQGTDEENSGTLSSTTETTGEWKASFTPDGSFFGDVIFEFVSSTSNSCPDEIKEYTLTITDLPEVIDQSYEFCEDTQGDGESLQDLTVYNTDITNQNLSDVTIIWYNDEALSDPVNDEENVVAVNGDDFYAKVQFNATNCFDVAKVDFTIDPQITATAGSDEEICNGEDFDLSTSSTIPTQSNAETLLWTTNGDGSFDDDTKLRPIYTPGTNDFNNSPITLTLTASNSASCPDVIDVMELTIKPVPVINSVTDIDKCPNESEPSIAFSADIAGGTFTWTATNFEQLGLGAGSGTGDFPSFTTEPNNTGNTITSEVTIDYLLNGCSSISETFNINVLPTPVIDDVANINVCPGEEVDIIFSANTTGETFNWTNDDNSIGTTLASSGSGDINFTAAENFTGTTQTSEFTYSATLDGCISIEKTFTVNLLPEPVLTSVDDFEVCSFDNITTNFQSNVSGSLFSWTNDNTATGIPASGNGNINVTATENITSAQIVSNITVTASRNGCISEIETFTVTLKPKPVINDQANIEICPGDEIASIGLIDDSGGNSTISWTATNASAIGLPASSGTGNIPAFTAGNNNSTSTITSNITVTSIWNGCVSDQESFQIQLKPTPIMNSVPNTELCAGEVYSVSFSNSLASGTTYNWVNDNTNIGLAASGSGNIIFTTSSNTTGSSIIANITVTPINNSCEGPEEEFTLTLNPTPVLTTLPNVEYCSDESAIIPISTDLTGVNFSINVSDNSLFSSDPVLNGENIEFTTTINTSGSDLTSNITVTAEKNGCESNESFTVTLKNRAIINSEADEAPLCSGDIVSSRTFTHDSGTGDFSWEILNSDLIGDGTSTSGNGSFPGFELAENISGDKIEGYVKYFSESNGCLSLADSFKITLKPSPVILNVDTAFCEGEFVNIEFFDNVNDNAIYEWQIDNLTIGINNSDGTTNQFITPAGFTAVNPSDTEDNVANITVFSTIDGCAGPVKTIEVRVLPNPTLSNNILEFTTCSNETFTFIPESSISSTDFEWNFISGDTTVVNGVELSGTGEINLDLINTSGTNQDLVYEITPLNNNCIGTSEELTITVTPEIKFENLENEYFVCSGQDFELPITLANDLHLNDIEYDWTVSENESGANDSTATIVGGNLTNSVSGQRDTVIYTITPKLLDGTCSGNTKVISVIINPNAIVEILDVNDICEGDNITLEAQLLNGAGSGQWSGGNGIFTSITSPITTYIPDENEFGENITLRFTANDPDGSGPCTTSYDEVTFTINFLPNVAITGNPFPNNLYCIRNGIQELNGSPAGGIFSGRGIFEEDGKYFFNPEVATVGGPYTINYEFTNSNGCINSTETTVQVTNGPNSDFDIDTDDSEGFFCSNAFLELDPASAGGTFSGGGIVITGGITYFDAASPEVAGLDSVEITYTIFEDETSCTAFTTKTIKRIPAPEIEIVYQNVCEIDNAVQIFIEPGYNHSQDSLISYQLEYENSPNRIYEAGQIEQFNSPGVKTITVIGTSALGCVFETTTNINVGNIQKTDFSVSNLKTSSSGQDPTQFTNESMLNVLNGDPSINSIISFNWDFGVEGIETDTSTLENPSFNYENAGAYNVRLIIESSLGCSDTIIKKIDIVPAIDSYPYLETFNESSGGWYTETSDTTQSSWIHDFPNGAFEGINDNPSPQKIWKTAKNGVSGYSEFENSYLFGPSFDLTNLDKPMIAFDMWLDVENQNRAGAIIEFSTDGVNWKILGEINDELNWYNTRNTFPIGGEFSNSEAYAWSFIGDQRQWIRTAHTINESLISDLSSVIFRINFRTHSIDGSPTGMAIDNFYVGERQKLVLLESFTNLNSTNYNNNRTNVESLMDGAVGKDLLPLNFHISIPTPDSINLRNSVELDARASIYDIESSPQLIIDGELFEGNLFESSGALDGEFQRIITRRSLLEPSNLIEVSIDNNADTNTIRFNATMTPNTDPNTNLIAHYFIVEKSTNNPELKNIVRKILPNINGIDLNDISETTTNTYEWEVNSIYSSDDLAIVSIVQDRITNRIFEIDIVDIEESKKSKIILNIKEGFESIGMDLYPNPSRGNINIRFSKALNSEIDIMILDSNGKIIKTTKIASNTVETELDLNGIASGVYHIISKNSNGDLNRQKIVLID